MYQAIQPTQTGSYQKWIDIFDFAGYIVFFISIFFVMHAVYIIVLSVMSAKTYDSYFAESLAHVITDIQSAKTSSRDLFYKMRFLSFSPLRERAEFKIINALFRDTYLIPSHFNFGLYLSGCLEKYSMRIINVSYVSWLILLLLFGVNYMRVKYGNLNTYNCGPFRKDSSPDVHSENDNISQRCALLQLQYFFICGVLMLLFVFCVHFMGKLYIIR